MAQSGFTPILLYASGTASAAPSAGNLTSSASGAELALNYADGKLFYKDSGGVVQTLATKATGTIGGSNTQVQYNSSGSLAGSANLTFNGTTLTANTLNLTNPLTTAHGGTGLASWTAGDLPYYAAGTALTKLGIGSAGQYLSSSGSAPQWTAPAALTKTDDTNVTLTLGGSASTALLNAASLTLGWTGQLAVGRGGTGASSFTANGVIYGNATGALLVTAAGTTGQVLVGNTGGAPSWAAATGVSVTSLSFGTTGLTPSVATQGAITVAGTLVTSNGGTGLSSYTAGDLIYYAAGTALTKLAIGASTTILTSTGTDPQWSTASSITVGTATNAVNTGITANSTNATNFLTFVSNTTGNLPQLVNSGISCNPSTGSITGGISAGTF